MYKAARQGIELERKPRQVYIKLIELVRMRSDGFDLKVICSKGTYIRTLVYDIGMALGTGAHLKNLTRTRIGRFGLEQAKTLDAFVSFATNAVRKH